MNMKQMKEGTMWIRIKGQLYNLAFATNIDCNLKHQFIVLRFGNAGVARGTDQHFHVHHDTTIIDFNEKEGDKIDDCHNIYLKILNIIGITQDDNDDFKREGQAD